MLGVVKNIVHLASPRLRERHLIRGISVSVFGRETERTRGISSEACRNGLDPALLIFERPQHMSHTTESSFRVFFIIIIISVKELGHLLTRSGLTYPEVSSKV
jgi:hypothetical protein